MSNEALTPEIRFEGYDGGWTFESLSNQIEYYSGLTYSPDNVKKYGTLVLRSSNVQNGEVTTKKDTVFVDPEVVNSEAVKKNDIIMVVRNGSRALIGKHATINYDMENTVIGAFMTGFRTDVPQFISALLDSANFHSEVEKNMGATINQITNGMLKNMSFYFPTKKEQEYIGKLFNQISTNINMKDTEIKKLQNFKQAMLQKMFPKEGERMPEVHFEGFEEDWESYELGDIADITGGGTPSTANPTYWNGTIDWYSPVEIGEKNYVDGSQNKITKLGLENSSAKILPVGTVLFTSRAGIGNTAILAKEGATNQGFQSILPHENVLDSYFIYARTNELKSYGENKGAGSTFIEVSGKQMKKMPILIPSIEEQKQIGQYFSKLDKHIQAKQAELKKLKQFKQAMLNKLFV